MNTLNHYKNFAKLAKKRIALIGMSGVGKTSFANFFPKNQWFHYSVDYRIGTRYLNEDISDFLKKEAFRCSDLLAQLLRSDSIAIQSKLRFNNLAPLSAYLSMVGDIKKGGISLEDFSHRLEKHRIAEIEATNDTPEFIDRAQTIYNYPHFICDTSGSLCELNEPEVYEKLAKNCLIIYLRADESMHSTIIARSQSHPKPLYYQKPFLLNAISEYCRKTKIDSWDLMDPQDFVRWVVPKLFAHRLDLYQSIADKHGITLNAADVYEIHSEEAMYTLIDRAIEQKLSKRS